VHFTQHPLARALGWSMTVVGVLGAMFLAVAPVPVVLRAFLGAASVTLGVALSWQASHMFVDAVRPDPAAQPSRSRTPRPDPARQARYGTLTDLLSAVTGLCCPHTAQRKAIFECLTWSHPRRARS
jgi:hypothetical protein